MPRDASGVMTLPAGNPVVAGTAASATAFNNTMEDLRAEVQDSLSRSGKGGMTAPFKVADGSVTAPGLAFTSDPNCGLYRIGADNVGFSLGGVKVADLATSFMRWISQVADGASAIAHSFDTVNALANATAKLMVWSNGGNAKGYVRAGGEVVAPNTPAAWGVVNWNGSTATVSSGNGIASVTGNANDFTVTLSRAFSTNSFAVVVTPQGAMPNTFAYFETATIAPPTGYSAFTLIGCTTAGAVLDLTTVTAISFSIVVFAPFEWN